MNSLARQTNRVCFYGLIMIFMISFFVFPQSAYAVSDPTVSISSSADALIGESYSFTVGFENTGADPGYGPFVDLIFPVNGADGAAGTDTADGIDFLSASYLGNGISPDIQIFPDDGSGTGCVDHPFALDSAGNIVEVCGVTGDKLVVLMLPYGSYTPAQPILDIDVNATVSELADVSTALTIQARAGFQFGNDPLNNPTLPDPTIISNYSNLDVTPSMISLSKTYNGPESETATGPNFPRRYTIDVNIADGQTIDDLQIRDVLPNNIAYLSIISTSPSGGTVLDEPTIGVAANSPDNELVFEFSSVTGSTSDSDAQLVFEYFVPEFDADGIPVIDPTTGDDATAINDASAQGEWDPIDTRDSSSTVTSDVTTNDHTLTPKSIAIQKDLSIENDTGASGYTPGDTLEYTLTFQISDYFSFDNIVVTDVLSDGQRYDPSFTPTVTIEDFDESHSGTFTLGDNFTIDTSQIGNDTNPITDGSTSLIFDVSDVITDLGGADGVLRGGYADSPNQGQTTATIVFHAIIQDIFTDTYPTGDESVDMSDSMNNSVTIDGDIVDNLTLLPTGESESDNSGASLSIVSDSLNKEIYAINGNTAYTQTRISPGDEVTYRLRDAIPTTDFENFTLIDYLPLPVFDASTVTTFNDVIDASVPPSGVAKFGPAETLRPISGIVPSISVDTAANSVTFAIGSYDNPSNPPAEVDIIFTVTVNDEPFADNLLLTNQFSRTLQNTEGATAQAEATDQITLAQPSVDIFKGAVATDNSNGIFSPVTVGPVTFTDPPSGSCPRFSGTLHSQDLASDPVNSNISNVDAADIVTFAIVLENSGRSPSGAFDVEFSDVIPTGFQIPTGGLNLCVTDGTGASIPYSDLGGGLFGSGLKLTDPGATANPAGALDNYDDSTPDTGRNVAVITYDLELTIDVEPDELLENTASLNRYAGVSGGANHVPIAKTDDATTTTTDVEVDKSIDDTNQAHTTGNNVAIGEQIDYETNISIPEGTLTDVTLDDQLDSGLAIVSMGSIGASSGLSTTAGTFTDVLANAIIAADGGSFQLDFDEIVNSNTDNSITESIDISYTVVVLNTTGNVDGLQRNNRATFTWDEGSDRDNAQNATIVEPDLQVVKTATPSSPDGGDTVTFQMTVSHTGDSNADAFEVELTDTIPAGFTYVASSLVNVSGLTATLDDSAAPDISASWSNFPEGSSSTIQLQATLSNTVVSGDDITNQSTVIWSSLPGDVTSPQSTHNALSCERTGDTNDCGTTANTYSHTDSATVTVTSPQIDKHPPSPTSYTIGETITFDLVITLAEGTTQDLVVLDDLPPGLSYNTGTMQIIDTASASGGLLVDDYSGTLTSPSPTGGGDGGEISIDFGTTVTPADGDGNNDSFVIRLEATVLNTLSNQNQNTKNNVGRVRFTDPDTGTTTISDTEQFTIIEPILDIVKTVTPDSGDAGDTLSFEIVIDHNTNSAADAFDLVFTDSIPTEFINITNVNVTASNITPPSFNLTGQDLRVPASGTFDLPQNASVTITFDADVASFVSPEETVTNSGSVTWSSLDGSVSGERTDGDGLLNDGSLNDYELEASDTFSTNGLQLVKTVTGTSESHTSGTDFAIGEVVTYSLTVTLPEAAFPSLQIRDSIPNGMQYVAGSYSADLSDLNSTLTGSGITFATPSGNATVNGANGEDITLDISPFNVTADNVSSNNSFSFSFDTLILDIAGNQGTSNPGTSLPNMAGIRVLGTDPFTNSNQTSGEVVEPLLTINKTANPTSADAGDTIDYTIVIENTGETTAFDINWQDTLPNEMFEPVTNLPSLTSVTHSTLGVLSEGSNFTSNFAANPMTITFDTSINAGDTITIVYEATIEGGVGQNQALTNTSQITSYSSLDGTSGNERSYGPVSDTATVTTSIPALVTEKTITSSDTHIQNDQTVTYQFTINNVGTVPAYDVDVTDILPSNFVYQAGTTQANWSGGGNSTADPTGSTTLNWDFNATINGGDNLTLTFDVIPTNVSVGTHVNTASANGNDGGSASLQGNSGLPADTDLDDTDDVSIEVTNPSVSISKELSAGQDNFFTIGEDISYDITITNNGSTTITTLPVVDTYDESIVSFVSSTVAPDDNNDDGELNWTDITTTFGDVAPTDSVSFTLVFNLHTVTELVENTAAVESAVDEHGDNANDVSDLDNTAAGIIDFTLIKSANPPNDSIVLPDDVVTYTISYSNNSTITLTGVEITDGIESGQKYREGTLRVNGTEMTDTQDGDQAFYIESGPTVRFILNDLAPGESGEVSFEVTVLDTETQIKNTARVTTNTGFEKDSNTVRLFVDPIEFSKKVIDLNVGGVESGDTLLWEITVTNVGESATVDLTIIDKIPDELTYVPNSIEGIKPDDTNAPELKWNVGQIALGGKVHLRYKTRVNDGLSNGTVIENLASLHDSQHIAMQAARSVVIGQSLNPSDEPEVLLETGANLRFTIIAAIAGLILSPAGLFIIFRRMVK